MSELGQQWGTRGVVPGFPCRLAGFVFSSNGHGVVGRDDLDIGGVEDVPESPKRKTLETILTAEVKPCADARALRFIFGDANVATSRECGACGGTSRKPASDPACECDCCACEYCDDGNDYTPSEVRCVDIGGTIFDANVIACALANARADGPASFAIVPHNGGGVLILRGANWIVGAMCMSPAKYGEAFSKVSLEAADGQ